jgi:hypothetical protein
MPARREREEERAESEERRKEGKSVPNRNPRLCDLHFSLKFEVLHEPTSEFASRHELRWPLINPRVTPQLGDRYPSSRVDVEDSGDDILGQGI